MVKNLYPHQLRGVEFLRSTPRALLADEMGLGKTVQTISALEGITPILVICPTSVMGVWEREVLTWAPGRKVTLLRGSLEKRRQVLSEGGLDFVVVNYEVVSKLLPDLIRVSWSALVLDEAHRVKNRKAQVTKAVQTLSRPIPRRYLLTGTPILNRPDDLWALLNILYQDRYRSYWKFVETYCHVNWNGFGWEVSGLKHPQALAQEVAPFFLRREKSEVLSDLPEKLTQQIWVELEGDQLREYQRMRKELISILEDGTPVTALMAVTQLLRLRQICVGLPILSERVSGPLSGAKAQALLDLIENCNHSKFVVFSQYSRAIQATARLLDEKGISYVTLTGETPQTQRRTLIEEFQDPSGPRGFLTTITSGGQGITLTSARIAIFLDKAWVPALNAQAADRLHRVGQKSTVWIYEILASGTVEEYVEKRLNGKIWQSQELIESILKQRAF